MNAERFYQRILAARHAAEVAGDVEGMQTVSRAADFANEGNIPEADRLLRLVEPDPPAEPLISLTDVAEIAIRVGATVQERATADAKAYADQVTRQIALTPGPQGEQGEKGEDGEQGMPGPDADPLPDGWMKALNWRDLDRQGDVLWTDLRPGDAFRWPTRWGGVNQAEPFAFTPGDEVMVRRDGSVQPLTELHDVKGAGVDNGERYVYDSLPRVYLDDEWFIDTSLLVYSETPTDGPCSAYLTDGGVLCAVKRRTFWNTKDLEPSLGLGQPQFAYLTIDPPQRQPLWHRGQVRFLNGTVSFVEEDGVKSALFLPHSVRQTKATSPVVHLLAEQVKLSDANLAERKRQRVMKRYDAPVSP